MDFKADLRDISFILNEYLKTEKLLALPPFSGFSADDFNMIIDEAAKMAAEVFYPLNKVSDKVGATYDPATAAVKTAPGYKKAFGLYSENSWGASSVPAEHGGMGLPETVAAATGELFTSACCAFMLAPGLSKAAANVIIKFGTEKQKETYVSNILTGKWTGTMCLTEPQAGSDVGAVKTMARPIEGRPGSYKITGTKIFISFGEHDLTENIIHLVLARTPDAPAGTKGISMFVIPKMRVNPDGSVSAASNDVICSGIEHKMGIHGSPTCTMNFGDNNDCEGELIGEVNMGMKYMFTMMNEERLMVGLQGLSLAAASNRDALTFAKERIQGSTLKDMKDPAAKKVAIIEHPDVRRMLLTMRAHTEAMRALIYNTAYYLDIANGLEDKKEARKYSGWVELLTPVCKAFCTDTAFEVTTLGVQVHGGYGYCSEYPAGQHLRDCKITSIYEGTNGIQALDFVGRKLTMGGGAVLMSFVMEINSKLEEIKKHRLAPLAAGVEKARDVLAGALALCQQNPELATINACSLLEMFGAVVCSFYLLEEAIVASDKLEELAAAASPSKLSPEDPQARFYYGKITTTYFYIDNLLPRIFWRAKAIKNGDTSCLKDVF
jgi:hypothetical protein